MRFVKIRYVVGVLGKFVEFAIAFYKIHPGLAESC